MIFLLKDVNPSIYNPVCIFLILLFGIPHGAVDHHIYLTLNRAPKAQIKFIARYVTICCCYAFWWYLQPGKAVIAFLFFSTYHFGQDILEGMGYPKSNFFCAFLWGGVILIVPLCLAYKEIVTNLVSTTFVETADVPISFLIVVVCLICMAALSHALISWRKGFVDFNHFLEMVLMLIFIIVMYYTLPFLVAFTIYFILFHSKNAFQTQYHWLNKHKVNYNKKKFVKDLFPLSTISVLGVLLFTYIVKPESWLVFSVYFFIFISIITLPHTLLFHDFYRFKRSRGFQLSCLH